MPARITPTRALIKSRVIVDPATKCWNWIGCDGSRHARLCQERASRVSYRLFVGEIPDDVILLHSCDNMACVNPGHLSPGTHLLNAIDRDTKGRNGTTKLTKKQVLWVMRQKGRKSQRQIGLAVGVSGPTVHAIHHGTRYKWILARSRRGLRAVATQSVRPR